MSVNSLAAMAVNKTETTLRLNENDGYALMGAKAVTRAVVDTALTVAALAETLVFATLTILASPGGLFEMTSAPFNFAKEHTAEAGKATFNAFKGIVGYNSIAKENPGLVEILTRWETFKATMSDIGSYISSKAAELGPKIERKHVLTGAAVAGLAIAGIYFRSNIADGVSSFAKTAGNIGMDYVLKPAYSIGNATIGDYAIRPAYSLGDATIGDYAIRPAYSLGNATIGDYAIRPAFSLANSTIGDYAIRPVMNFVSSFFQSASVDLPVGPYVGPVAFSGPLLENGSF